MENNFVLDTNIILKEPNILNLLPDSRVIIPSVVLQELDSKKTADGELGRNARVFVRMLDKLYQDNYYIESTNTQVEVTLPSKFDKTIMDFLGGEYTNDDKIVYTAYEFNKIYQTSLISDDGLVRLKARSIGLDAMSFTSKEENKNIDESYKGYYEHYLPDALIDTLYNNKFLDLRYIKEIMIYPHMFFILKGDHPNKSALAKVDKDCKFLSLVERPENVWGITPKNSQQIMLMNLLLDDEISLVTISGKAGTGKTLLTMAAGLVLAEEEDFYDKIICTKPTVDMGKGIGFLPGDKDEKLGPYMQSYMDNLEVLFGGEKGAQNALNGMQKFEIDALNYIRGRSIPRQFMIVDEAQNLSKHEIKTIVTRMGEGSKIIIMGDPNQIDHPFLDSINNGLTHVVEAFKDQKIGAHITLEKSERSELAEIASEIL